MYEIYYFVNLSLQVLSSVLPLNSDKHSILSAGWLAGRSVTGCVRSCARSTDAVASLHAYKQVASSCLVGLIGTSCALNLFGLVQKEEI